jgi:hypothetical protein
MATTAEIIYDVREAVRQTTDDSEISDKYILYLYNIKRSKYLRQDLNNLQKTIDISILQTLCLELEEVNVNECGLDLECETIMRTKRPLPKLLELHLKPSIVTVKPTTRTSLPFNFTTKERAIYSKYSPFNRSIFAFLDADNHIYLISESDEVKLLECLTITAIFEDPLELQNYTNCCGCTPAENPCFDYFNSKYPIQAHHIDIIRNEIVQTLIGTLSFPEDKNNNSDDQ